MTDGDVPYYKNGSICQMLKPHLAELKPQKHLGKYIYILRF